MIVKDVRTALLSVPYTDPPRAGYMPLERIDLVVVEVETASGVVGTGHLQPITGGIRTLELCIHEVLKPLLIGEEISDIPRLWRKMWDATFIQGRMGLSVMAMSALDIALWDALGRARGVPLWQLWGGRRDPVPVYGSGCYRGLGHDGMIEKAERFVAQGFAAIKMQCAHMFTADEDVANVRDMRATLGDGIEIMIDANQGWSVEEAIAVGKRLDAYELSWLEEPVMADDFEGYARIGAVIETPLATGENNFTHRDLLPFLKGGHVAVLQPDIMRGGYTDLRIIAERAHGAGLAFAPHLFPELSVHLNASVPNGAWLEYMGWHDHLWVEPLLPVGGMLTPTDRPGHGMDFKPELFREFAYRA